MTPTKKLVFGLLSFGLAVVGVAALSGQYFDPAARAVERLRRIGCVINCEGRGPRILDMCVYRHADRIGKKLSASDIETLVGNLNSVPEIWSLDLSDSDLNDKSIESLCKLKAVHSLYLRNTDLTIGGIETLAESQMQIWRLDLRCTDTTLQEFKDRGAMLQQLVRKIPKGSTAYPLRIDCCHRQGSDRDVEELTKAYPELLIITHDCDCGL